MPFDIPFAFPTIGVASRVISKQSSFGTKFIGDLESSTGLKVLGSIDSGDFFAFTNSKKTIVKCGRYGRSTNSHNDTTDT